MKKSNDGTYLVDNKPMYGRNILKMYDQGELDPTTPIIQGDKVFSLSDIGKKQEIISATKLKTQRRDRDGYPLLPVMDFSVCKGEMIYIIGKSGAGKTVLLKILGGYDKQVTNDAKFMGKLTWHDNNKGLKKHIGYVPQIDSLYIEMTPARLLSYYRRQFKSDMDVYQLLEDLGLGHRAEEKIESLSGGERKRVSIAIELLRNADIILLDEPDSGLDPDSRKELYRLLDKINIKMGKTIILSTHYQDNIETNTVEPIDLFINAAVPQGKGVVKMYRRTQIPAYFHEDTPPKPPLSPATPHRKPAWLWDSLLSREFHLYRNNALVLAFVSFICMGFLWLATGSETFNEYNSALPVVFAMACGAILIGLMLSINMVCKDYDMIRRELRMGISARSLILSKGLLIIFLCAVMSGILAFPYLINAYNITNQRPMFLYLAVFATMLSSAQLGLFVSAISRNKAQQAALSIPFVMLFQILFSGFVFEDVRVRLDTIAISNYSIRAMGSALNFDNPDFIWDTPHGAFESTWCHIINNVYVIGGFFVLALIVSIAFLYLVDKKGGS
ncbi:MAG: ATP-binding cassette domain-containing protein [Defluviitaleaceae bacterium]|nr:ATP-binding cassette domain-containing protein [Defluviitaleaceae bacterium]